MKRLETILRKYNKQLKLAVQSNIRKNPPPHSTSDEYTPSLVEKKQQIYQLAANHIIEKVKRHYNTLHPKEVKKSRKDKSD